MAGKLLTHSAVSFRASSHATYLDATCVEVPSDSVQGGKAAEGERRSIAASALQRAAEEAASRRRRKPAAPPVASEAQREDEKRIRSIMAEQA